VKDYKSKGSPGERNFNSKLTEGQVRTIRGSDNSNRYLSDLYNVDINTIRSIIQRKTWKHI
jgi:hypothetical protein